MKSIVNRMTTFGFILFTITAYVLPNGVCSTHFTYDGEDGPKHWKEQYAACGGKHQSPININMLNVKEKQYGPLTIKNFLDIPLDATLLNNGHTVLANFEFENKPSITGGPLRSRVYTFAQFHFHWGQNNSVGSEDLVNNVAFPGELHVVFYDSSYSKFEEAILQPRGVTVCAFFFWLSAADNSYYTEFIELLSQVREPNDIAHFKEPPELYSLLNFDFNEYFTYIGSLTTPPCSEEVIWIEFTIPISISEKQLDNFRLLHTYDGQPLTHNFRPVQPLNDRVVYHNKGIEKGTPFLSSVKSASNALSVQYICGFFLIGLFYSLSVIIQKF